MNSRMTEGVMILRLKTYHPILAEYMLDEYANYCDVLYQASGKTLDIREKRNYLFDYKDIYKTIDDNQHLHTIWMI